MEKLNRNLFVLRKISQRQSSNDLIHGRPPPFHDSSVHFKNAKCNKPKRIIRGNSSKNVLGKSLAIVKKKEDKGTLRFDPGVFRNVSRQLRQDYSMLSAITSRKDYNKTMLAEKENSPTVSPSKRILAQLEKQYEEMLKHVKWFPEIKEELLLNCASISHLFKNEGKYKKMGEEFIIDEILNMILKTPMDNYTKILKKMSGLYRSGIRHVINNDGNSHKTGVLVLEKLWILSVVLIDKIITSEREMKDEQWENAMNEMQEKIKQSEEINTEEITKLQRMAEINQREIARLQAKVKNLVNEKKELSLLLEESRKERCESPDAHKRLARIKDTKYPLLQNKEVKTVSVETEEFSLDEALKKETELLKTKEVLMKDNPLYKTIQSALAKNCKPTLRMSDSALQLYLEQLISSYMQLPPKKRQNFPAYCFSEIQSAKNLKYYIVQTLLSMHEALKNARKHRHSYGMMLGKLLELFMEKFTDKEREAVMKAIHYFVKLQKANSTECGTCIKSGGYVACGFLVSKLNEFEAVHPKALMEKITTLNTTDKTSSTDSRIRFALHKLKFVKGDTGLLGKDEQVISWADFAEKLGTISQAEKKKEYIKENIEKSVWEKMLTQWELSEMVDYLWIKAMNGGILETLASKRNDFIISKMEFIGVVLDTINEN